MIPKQIQLLTWLRQLPLTLPASFENLQSVPYNKTRMFSTTNVEPTVILGGGIIGLSTAYYLASANDGKTFMSSTEHSSIFVIDPSSKICAGASGQNEGALGDFGVQDNLIQLAQLSYKLHGLLAAENNGKQKFGFSGLKIPSVCSNGYDPSNPSLPFPVKEPEDLSKLPTWFKVPSTWQAGLIADNAHAMRL